MIRQLVDSDISRLTVLCNRAMEYDVFNEPILREKTIGSPDHHPDLGLVYEVDGEVVAFGQGNMGKVRDGKQFGYVRLGVVDRAYRRRGIGSALLKEMESRLVARGVQVISIMDSPFNYYMPGVDFRYTEAYCFLQKHGYKVTHETHNLICELDVNAWPELEQQIEQLRGDNVYVTRAQVADGERIHAFLDLHWVGWKGEVQGALDNDPPTLYIAKMDERVVAFSGYQGNNKALNWFGPMGTSPELRGKGVGALLLRLCLRDLARQGWKTAVIPWVGPIPFYSKFCGAKIDRCFWVHRKEIG
ncbi:MAG: GNAT family N-acetyltransferase [Candidatus Sumerlaeaceae bacterium]